MSFPNPPTTPARATARQPARPVLTVRQTDALASKVLAHCHTAGVTDQVPESGTWLRFHEFRALLYETFEVPDTTLTPLSARVLYGLAAVRRPRRVAVLGCYAGNLFAWVSGPGFGPGHEYDGETALGIDVSAHAVALAEANVARAGFTGAILATGDAFDTRLAAGAPWDLVLIDIDVPGSRKSGYPRLAEAWMPYLAPGALIIAHDVCHPVFAWDLGRYHEFMLASGAQASTTLPVDACGLEVTRWRAG